MHFARDDRNEPAPTVVFLWILVLLFKVSVRMFQEFSWGNLEKIGFLHYLVSDELVVIFRSVALMPWDWTPQILILFRYARLKGLFRVWGDQFRVGVKLLDAVISRHRVPCQLLPLDFILGYWNLCTSFVDQSVPNNLRLFECLTLESFGDNADALITMRPCSHWATTYISWWSNKCEIVGSTSVLLHAFIDQVLARN